MTDIATTNALEEELGRGLMHTHSEELNSPLKQGAVSQLGLVSPDSSSWGHSQVEDAIAISMAPISPFAVLITPEAPFLSPGIDVTLDELWQLGQR